MLLKNFKLRELEIPIIGLGTNSLRGTQCHQTVNYALSLGYRHIDTSPSYLNQHMIAYSLARVPRNSVFITSKISYGFYSQERSTFLLQKSLENLSIAYLDLLLIEWPGVKNTENRVEYNSPMRREVWKSLLKLKEKGLVKHIGVSNFTIAHIEDLIAYSGYVPEVNQVEVHPLCFDSNLYEYLKRKEILMIAHTPLARKHNDLWENLDLKIMAKKYKVNLGQIILNWIVRKGIAVIPRSQNYEHIRCNSMVDFEMEKADLMYLDSLNKEFRISKDPTFIR